MYLQLPLLVADAHSSALTDKPELDKLVTRAFVDPPKLLPRVTLRTEFGKTIGNVAETVTGGSPVGVNPHCKIKSFGK